jgi:hypothetical protein
LTVTAAAANKLVIQTQPSSAASAGVLFAQQPQVRVEDQYGNLRSSDNSTVVTVARNAGNGTLQGTLSATAVNGVATFADLSHNFANTINLSFSSRPHRHLGATSSSRRRLLKLLVRRNRGPSHRWRQDRLPARRGTGTAVTINAVDAYWNLSMRSPTRRITQRPATLTSDAALLPAPNVMVFQCLAVSSHRNL